MFSQSLKTELSLTFRFNILCRLSSFCRPSQSYAALGQQLQVLERPGWEEAAQPATTSRVGAAVFQPWDFVVAGNPSLSSWGVSLPASQKGLLIFTLLLCSTSSVHMSVHTETTEGLSDRQLQQWPCWLLRACQTRTVTNRHGHTASLWTSRASQAFTV